MIQNILTFICVANWILFFTPISTFNFVMKSSLVGKNYNVLLSKKLLRDIGIEKECKRLDKILIIFKIILIIYMFFLMYLLTTNFIYSMNFRIEKNIKTLIDIIKAILFLHYPIIKIISLYMIHNYGEEKITNAIIEYYEGFKKPDNYSDYY
ncbi:hypothetical protein [Fusobacterium sp. MFO224]|uniref:hypothetical protein n=1 Tax=Fusobacterium sp. MFO224 TaxID=3378070 RepID=UPI003853A092